MTGAEPTTAPPAPAPTAPKVDPEVNPVLRPTPAVPRVDPELRASELVALPQWLDYHRATLLLKCDGLDPAQLATRAVPPSSLSLLGLLRHLTEVERSWSAGALAGRDVTPVYYSDDDPDGDFGALDSHPVDEVYAAYHAAVAESRAICAAFTSADEVGRGPRGPDRSVRWVLLHLIEEYARHNGHADLLREALDGVRGE